MNFFVETITSINIIELGQFERTKKAKLVERALGQRATLSVEVFDDVRLLRLSKHEAGHVEVKADELDARLHRVEVYGAVGTTAQPVDYLQKLAVRIVQKYLV